MKDASGGGGLGGTEAGWEEPWQILREDPEHKLQLLFTLGGPPWLHLQELCHHVVF